MKLFGRDTKEIKNAMTLSSPEFLSSVGIDGTSTGDKMGEITYFICMKTLCEIMGKLEIKKYKTDEKKGKERVLDNELNYLLNIEPNQYYTASTLKQSIELNRNHYGNAYVYTERYKLGRNSGKLKALWILPSNEVTIWMDDKGIFGQVNSMWYVWQDAKTGKPYKFAMNEILHFKSSITFDGIVGKSIKDILIDHLETAQSGQTYLKKLYKGNMQSSKILLYYTGTLDPKGEKALVANMENFSSDVGTGTFIPLPVGLTATTLDSKLVDAEFSVLKQANALSLAAAFGISPNFINDYSKSSYANSTTQQQALFQNTMQPIFKCYGEEYTRRLLIVSEKRNNTVLEVDTKALFKLNPIEQADVLMKQMQNFMITPNQAAEELGLPYIDDPKANTLIGNGNYISLDLVGTQYAKNTKQ
jgi:HK97 family phage portal protein